MIALAVCLALIGEALSAPLILLDSSPANNSIFFSSPGSLFELPRVRISTVDRNGTAAGTIIVTIQDLTFSWQGQSFVPERDPPDMTRAQASWISNSSFHMSLTDGFTNATTISYAVQDANDYTLWNYSMPYRRVCVTASTSAALLQLCYRIYMRMAPALVQSCSFNPSLVYLLPSNPRVSGCPIKSLQPSTVIAAGQTFEAWIYYQDTNRDGTAACQLCDSVNITVLSDPGLPNKATIGPSMGGPYDVQEPADHTNIVALGTAPGAAVQQVAYLYSKKLTFKPDATQFLTYRICVQGADSSPWALARPLPPLVSPKSCFKITVAPPDIRVDERTDFLPDRVPSVSPTPWPLRVRCTYVFSIYLYEAKDFTAVLDGLPAEAPAAGYKLGAYKPVAQEDPQNPLPPGAVLSDRETVMVCKDRTLNCANPSYPMTKQTITWTPARGTENSTFHVCVRIRDSQYDVGAYTRCVDWYVAMCEVCSVRGDTLKSIAQEYESDWLQLWGANNAISNPNMLLPPSILNLGPIYVNRAAQTPELLSKLFAMDLTTLLAVNPFLQADAFVPVGTEVCIMNRVCS